jgi:hypothetical protein
VPPKALDFIGILSGFPSDFVPLLFLFCSTLIAPLFVPYGLLIAFYPSGILRVFSSFEGKAAGFTNGVQPGRSRAHSEVGVFQDSSRLRFRLNSVGQVTVKSVGTRATVEWQDEARRTLSGLRM